MLLAALLFSTGPQLAQAAVAHVGVTTIYDPSYVSLRYPGGDLPKNRGVCADVIVRAFRAIGVDLQVEVHEDMQRHFAAYPKMWGLRAPDRNIDHRRVPNLMKFFERAGKSVSAADDADVMQAVRQPPRHDAFRIIGHYRW